MSPCFTLGAYYQYILFRIELQTFLDKEGKEKHDYKKDGKTMRTIGVDNIHHKTIEENLIERL